MPPLSDEDKQEVTTLIHNAVNGSAANLKKLFESGLAKSVETTKGELAKVTEALTKLSESRTEPTGDDPPPKNGKNGKTRDPDDRELLTLKRQIDELRTKSEESEKKAAAERAKNRSNDLRAAVAEVLEPLGITGQRFKVAYAYLLQNDLVHYVADDSDEIGFVEASGEVDYRTGLATWAKSDDAKMFIPPAQQQGAGTRPKFSGTPQVKSGGPMTKAERDQKMAAALGEWAENPR